MAFVRLITCRNRTETFAPPLLDSSHLELSPIFLPVVRFFLLNCLRSWRFPFYDTSLFQSADDPLKLVEQVETSFRSEDKTTCWVLP